MKIHLILWAFLIYILAIMWFMELHQLHMLHYNMQTLYRSLCIPVFSNTINIHVVHCYFIHVWFSDFDFPLCSIMT